MGQDGPSPICPRHAHQDLEPIFPVWSVMHGHHANITKVNLLLTEPSQVIEPGPGEGEQQAALHLCGSRGDGSRVSASHPETGTHCGAKQQRSPIPGRQPQQVASLHPRTAKVTCLLFDCGLFQSLAANCCDNDKTPETLPRRA